jgi:hypothetical protein|tara:strand:- start:5709 stop:5891 length:183 start_codon:yes stop_codon:yes gene_type:complete
MFIDFLLKAADVAIDVICEPLPDEQHEEYQPSTKSIAVDDNGNTVQLVGTSQGWKQSDLS